LSKILNIHVIKYCKINIDKFLIFFSKSSGFKWSNPNEAKPWNLYTGSKKESKIHGSVTWKKMEKGGSQNWWG